MACLEHLESMSALLDGELAAEESTRLERHLAGCTACKRAFEAMTGLGSGLTAAEPPELPSDFARKTADYVREHLVPAGPPPGLPARPRRWLDGFLGGNHPVLALVGARRRRPSLRAGEMLKVVAIFLLPALALGLFRDGLPLFNYLTVVGLGMMVAVPLYYFNNELALLGSLIKGRCLEEVLGTSLEPASTVDALATNSLRPILKACLPVAPVLVLGAAMAPAATHHVSLKLAMLWLPLTLLVFLGASYLALAWRIWARSTRLSVVGSLCLAIPLLGWLLGGLAVGALLAFLLAVAGRRLAIRGLEHPEQVTRLNHTTRKARRNRFLRLWSDNPITARELWRVSGSVPGGLQGVFAWRLTLLVVPLLWAMLTMSYPSESRSFPFWTGVAAFAFMLFLRAATRTLGSILSERQQQTWEPLLQTDLGAARFVRGWLEVAFHTVMLEGLLGAVSFMLFAAIVPTDVTATDLPSDGLRVALIVPVVLLFTTLVGALVGMALSASSRSLGEASQRLALLGALVVAGWLLLWGVILSSTYLLALVSLANTGGDHWADFVQHDSPMAAALTLGLGLMLWSSAVLRREVTSLENAPKTGTRLRFTYPLPVTLVESTALGVVGYLTLVFSVLFGARYSNDRDDTLVLGMLLGFGAAWWLLLRLPLATIAELVRGSRAAIVLGAAYGALAGLSYQLLPGMIRYLGSNEVIYSSRHTNTLETFLPFLVVALTALGGVLGAVEARRAPSPRRAALGRRLAVSGALSLLVLGGTALGLQSQWDVQVSDPAAVSEIRRRAEQRAAKNRATLPAHNGYEPLRGMLMARNERYRDWKDLGGLYNGAFNPTLLELLGKPSGIEARRRFESVLPQLRAALGRPEFSVGHRLDYSERIPNFLLMRSIAQGLAVLGYAEENEGNLEAAVDHYLLGLKWGDRMVGHGPLISEMIAVAMESYPLERLLDLTARRELSAEQYRAIIAAVNRSRFHPQHVADSLEAELAMGLKFLELPAAERIESEKVLGIPVPEAYMRLSRAQLANFYLEAIPRARRPRLPQALPSLQDCSPLAQVLIPNYSRAQEQSLLNLTRLEALRAIAQIQLYRLEHGRYPDRLPAEATAWIAPDHRFEYRNLGSTFTLGCASPPVVGKQTRWQFHPFTP